jgi:transposase
MHCQAALTVAEQVLHDLYDKVDLPPVRPVVTRVERYVGRCLYCGSVIWHRSLRAWSRVRHSA